MRKAFGKGQGFSSGNAIKFPLQVQIQFDKGLEWDELGQENFIQQNLDSWNNGGKQDSEESSKSTSTLKGILKK
jgi:uncharacterized protein